MPCGSPLQQLKRRIEENHEWAPQNLDAIREKRGNHPDWVQMRDGHRHEGIPEVAGSRLNLGDFQETRLNGLEVRR